MEEEEEGPHHRLDRRSLHDCQPGTWLELEEEAASTRH